MKWKVLKLRFEADDEDFYKRPQGDILWPNHFSSDEIAEIKSDPATYMALFQQEPQPHEGSWFSKEWLNYYEDNRLDPHKLNIYILVDPALSTKSSGNYTTMVVVGLGEDRNFYILSFYRDRVDPYQRADAIFGMVRRWHPIRVGYEQYGLLADIPYLRERMEQSNYRFNIQELGKKGPSHNLSKKDRIRQLIPIFREGRIWLPKEQLFIDSNQNEVDLVKIFIEQEYSRFPSSTYDDMIDALSRITDDAMRFEFPEIEEDFTPSSGSGGSWLAG